MTDWQFHELLESALDAPADEKNYFIRQAIALSYGEGNEDVGEDTIAIEDDLRERVDAVVDSTDTFGSAEEFVVDALETHLATPPGFESGKNQDEDEDDTDGTPETDEPEITLELTMPKAVLEMIERECNEDTNQTPEDWLLTLAWVELAKREQDRAETVTFDAELSEEFVERMKLRHRARQGFGKDVSLEDVIFDHAALDPRWTVEGDGPLFDDSD